MFSHHLGISSNPFTPYNKSVGWEPRFKVYDKRGSADKRALRDAERRTVSYEHLMAIGEKVGDTSQTHESYKFENDAAADWLKDNDPDMPA